VILLDTHAWIWWVSDPGLLSAAAQRAIDEAREEGAVGVSSISAWEVGMLVAKGRLELTTGVEEWVAKSETIPFLRFLPVDNAVAIRSVMLPGVLHPDPADRIIVATAMQQQTALVTKDARLQAYPHVRTVW